MTRGEMVGRVQQFLGLQQIDAYNEVPLVQDLLYRGTIDLLARTRCVVRCVHLHTQAGVDTYTLDHSILSLVDVDDGATRRARRDQTSGPSFTLIRSDILRLNPPPDDGVVDVWAVLRPGKMDSDDDSPGDENFGAIPEEFQDAIELYTLWRAADYTDNNVSQDGERYRMLYEGQDGKGGRLREIRQLVNKRGTARAAGRRTTLTPLATRDAWVG